MNLGPTDGKKVVAMSLYGTDPKYIMGAIRNAQMVHVNFPGWRLRVYVEDVSEGAPSRYPIVAPPVLQKLKQLSANVVPVNLKEMKVPPMMWRFLVADDLSVDYFIVRDTDSRLTRRDAIVTHEWLKSGKAFGCVRDHPAHQNFAVNGGMWGGRPRQLRKILGKTFQSEMIGRSDQYLFDIGFLGDRIWHRISPADNAFCHDSVACKQPLPGGKILNKWKYAGSHPFPVVRREAEHVGRVYDEFDQNKPHEMSIFWAWKIKCEHATYNPDGINPLFINITSS
jgi:hypothetical protein